MDEFKVALVPISFILAGVIVYVGNKKGWKFLDYF
jgi:hypothetical protein